MLFHLGLYLKFLEKLLSALENKRLLFPNKITFNHKRWIEWFKT